MNEDGVGGGNWGDGERLSKLILKTLTRGRIDGSRKRILCISRSSNFGASCKGALLGRSKWDESPLS